MYSKKYRPNIFANDFPYFVLFLVDQIKRMLLAAPCWLPQVWNSRLMEASVTFSFLLLPITPRIVLPSNTVLKNPKVEIQLLVANRTLRLATWSFRGNYPVYEKYKTQKFRGKLKFVLGSMV